MGKIKVFLGGYINYTNAQNINCRGVAEHLDKNNFQVYTLTTHLGHCNFMICTYMPQMRILRV